MTTPASRKRKTSRVSDEEMSEPMVVKPARAECLVDVELGDPDLVSDSGSDVDMDTDTEDDPKALTITIEPTDDDDDEEKENCDTPRDVELSTEKWESAMTTDLKNLLARYRNRRSRRA